MITPPLFLDQHLDTRIPGHPSVCSALRDKRKSETAMNEGEAKPCETSDILFWDPLLELVDEGRVIPVVGRDLLIGNDGRDLYGEIAAQLAVRLGQSAQPLPIGNELNEVSYRHLARGGSLRDIYPGLKIVAGQVLKDYPIPEVLLQLARIKPLRLFVTTTFDPLLIRALNQERAGGTSRNANDRLCAE